MLFICLLPNLSAQSSSRMEYTYELEYNSEKIENIVDVKNNSENLAISFQGVILEGALTIVAYDPSGKKETTLSLISSGSDTSTNSAKGNIQELFDNPKPGIWKIFIDTKNVTGRAVVLVDVLKSN